MTNDRSSSATVTPGVRFLVQRTILHNGRNCAAAPLSVHSPLVLEGFLTYDTAFRPKMSLFALSGRPLTGFSRLACLVVAGVFVGLLVLAATVNPDPRGYGTHEQLGLTPCAFRTVFNLPCPSCGGTTSFAHYIRGEWRSAFQANAAAFAFALLMSLLTPWLTASAISGRLLGVRHPGWTFIAFVGTLAVMTLLNWMIRLLPAIY
jgi:hypothetical protein